MSKRGRLRRVISQTIRAVTGSDPPPADDEEDDTEPEAEPSPNGYKNGEVTKQFKTTMATLSANAEQAKEQVTKECKTLKQESLKLRRTLTSVPEPGEIPSK